MPAPEVRDDGVTWRIPSDLAPGGARLEVDWVLAGDREFARDGDSWTYDLRRPAARRLEYRLILRDADGHGDPSPDPTNPARVGNPFGDRSLIEFADYVAPSWVDIRPAGELARLQPGTGRLDTAVPAQLWTPDGLEPDRPAPLLVADDGTGLANDAGLLSWATAQALTSRPLRVLLLDPAPGRRDDWYAADDDHSDDVANAVLRVVRDLVAVSGAVGLGISLGAVATLALQRRHPQVYDAIVLQSGSFFTPATDPQESAYGKFDQVCAAVRRMKLDPPERVVPALLTCGAIEENLANNIELARALTRQGYAVESKIVPGAHTMIDWRDSWSPELDQLIERALVAEQRF